MEEGLRSCHWSCCGDATIREEERHCDSSGDGPTGNGWVVADLHAHDGHDGEAGVGSCNILGEEGAGPERSGEDIHTL